MLVTFCLSIYWLCSFPAAPLPMAFSPVAAWALWSLPVWVPNRLNLDLYIKSFIAAGGQLSCIARCILQWYRFYTGKIYEYMNINSKRLLELRLDMFSICSHHKSVYRQSSLHVALYLRCSAITCEMFLVTFPFCTKRHVLQNEITEVVIRVHPNTQYLENNTCAKQ